MVLSTNLHNYLSLKEGKERGRGGKVEEKKEITCSFLDPLKTTPLFFNYTPKKGKSLFWTVDKNKPVQLKLYQFRKNCTKGTNCTTTYTRTEECEGFPCKCSFKIDVFYL